MEVTGQLNAPAGLLLGEIHGTFRIGGPGGSNSSSGVLEKRRLLDPECKDHIF
jgi:hypothetical protein